MADPTVNGPEGDGGIDGVMSSIGDAFGSLIRGAGDYLHEKFFNNNNNDNRRPESDAPYYRDGRDSRSPNERVKGKSPKGKYRGFEFWPITGLWAVGAAVAVVGLVILLRRR